MRNKHGHKKFIVATLAAVLMAAVGLGACKHGCGSPEAKAKWIKKMVSGKLDLNDAQKAKLDVLVQAVLDHRKAHEADRDAFFATITAEIQKPELDRKTADRLMAEHEKTAEAVLDQLFPKFQDFHRSLTPEQKTKAIELLKDLKDRFHGND